MTEFERMWNELNPSPPPVDTIVVEARRREVVRRRRRTAVVGVASLAAAFAGGIVVANPPSGLGGGGIRPVAFQADLLPARSCDELLESYRDRGAELVTAWGWSPYSIPLGARTAKDMGGQIYEGPVDGVQMAPQWAGPAGPGDFTPMGGREADAYTGMGEAQGNSATGTNVQEVGVDEPDSVKTDGKVLVRFREGDLLVYDVAGKEPRRLARLPIPKLGPAAELLLVGDRVVVVAMGSTSYGKTLQTQVVSVSIDDPAKPEVTDTVTYDGQVLSARQHGDAVRLVLAAGLPDLDFVTPGGSGGSEQSALAQNRKVVAKSTIEDWLPQYRSGKDDHELLECGNVAVPPGDAGLDTVSIVGINADEIDEPHAIALAAATTIAYASTDHLYLASSPATWGCWECELWRAPLAVAPDDIAPPNSDGTSRIYDFTLDGVDATHIASGEVEGTIADRWAMDEARGVLRVAVGPSSETGNFNSVVTLAKHGDDLAEIGRLDHLGEGETLHGMRWFDSYAFLVTYRTTDPLLSISLKDPEHPTLLGELKIPGFSDYLHPIGDSRILGVGQADNGADAQIGLFDAHNLGAVKRTDVVQLKAMFALAGTDPRTFTWLPDRETALVVVQHEREVLIAAVAADGTQLSSTTKRVEYGDDGWRVRTMELPDGRVLLVTGEDVEIFAVP